MGTALATGNFEVSMRAKISPRSAASSTVNDELPLTQAAVESDIPDRDQAEGLDDLSWRRRPGNDIGKIHRTVHNHAALRHFILFFVFLTITRTISG